jgi:predicted permease
VTIVGVMPAGFGGFYVGVEPDIWWPLQLVTRLETAETSLQSLITTEGWEWLLMIGRLAPGVTLDAARTELRALFQQELAEFAAPRQAGWSESRRREHFARTLELDPGGRGFTIVRARFVQPVTILMVVVGVVLLIACANVAGLLLARGAARQREFAVRTSLGAGRARLLRQLATESLVLALAGGALGVFLGYWGTKLLARYLPPPGGSFNLAPDQHVLLFATAASVLTAVLFGLLPAWRSSRVDLAAAMKQQSAQAGGRSRLNSVLVVVQIALSVALLAGAGLFVRTLRNLRTADLGFQREHEVRFSLASPRRFDAEQWRETSGRLLQALEASPGVRSASAAAGGLMSGDSLGTRFAIEGYTPQPDEEMRAQYMVVRARFFETLGVPIVRGRGFTAAEAGGATDGSARKVVIGETLARRFFGDTDPIGRTLRSGLNNTPPLEIIGVARDIKYRNARERPLLEYFLPYGDSQRNFRMNFYVRTRDDTSVLIGSLRAIVRQVDPQLDLAELATLDDVVNQTFLQERVVAQLGGFLSGFALILASLGLYGMLSYGVVQRTREIGVRMALGATASKVVAFFVGQGVRLALLGAVLGVSLALATTTLVAKLLYDVKPNDPLTFGAVILLLLAVAAVAAWLPARRAAKVDPMVALRAE